MRLSISHLVQHAGERFGFGLVKTSNELTLPLTNLDNSASAIMIFSDDSQSAIKLSSNESINRRNKHIAITFHFLRDITQKKEVIIQHKPDPQRVADMTTTPQWRIKLEYVKGLCRLQAGMGGSRGSVGILITD